LAGSKASRKENGKMSNDSAYTFQDWCCDNGIWRCYLCAEPESKENLRPIMKGGELVCGACYFEKVGLF
jgi:hypothetical protein